MSRGRVVAVVALLLAMPLASAWPTPGFNGETAQEVTGRVFPKARETNDWVSYEEAKAGLQLLEEQAPDLLEYHVIGKSYGWVSAETGEREPREVFAVTVTDETAPTPESERRNLLFQLSIHGDEKGGREGGLRVIEDFVLAKKTGEDVEMATQERLAMLDSQRLIFVFANPDGWTHEEPEYRHNEACYNSATCDYSSGGNPDRTGEPGAEEGDFVRVNGNGTDLNRQAPVVGYVDEDHRTLEEPSTYHTFVWLDEEFDAIDYATDLHGMSPPADRSQPQAEDGVCADTGRAGRVCTKDGHFVLGMLLPGQSDPTQEAREVRVTARADRYINEDPAFGWWRATPAAGVVGGEVAAWGTLYDTLGGTASGGSNWYGDEHGFDAVTTAYEYAYNNFVTDNHYGPAGQEINRLFVAATRDIVAAFQDTADRAPEPVPVSEGPRIGWVPTDVAREPPEVDLPPRKMRFVDGSYRASVNGYFRNVSSRMPGDLARVAPGSVGEAADGLDVIVVPGSAAARLTDGDRAALEAFVRRGGRLVVTDEALGLTPELGVDVEANRQEAYVGYAALDRGHWLVDGVGGLARQTVSPIPTGYKPGGLPIWSYDAEAVEEAGGTVAGTSPSPEQASLGAVPLGDGDVVFVGSLLPDPTTRNHHPYRLADHGVTHTGRQVLRNAAGLTLADVGPDAGGPAGAGVPTVPGLGAAAVAAALAVLAVARRRD